MPPSLRLLWRRHWWYITYITPTISCKEVVLMALQARSQDFAKGGGAFLEVWYNRKRTWPKFSFVLNEIEAVFLSILGDFKKKKGLRWNSKGFSARKQVISKKKEKKRSSPTLGELQTKKTPLFWSKQQQALNNFASQIPFEGGLFSFFEQKSASKAQKTCYFAYFSGQWGRARAPPSYATVVLY